MISPTVLLRAVFLLSAFTACFVVTLMAIPSSSPLSAHRDLWSASAALFISVALSAIFIRSDRLSLQGVSFKALAIARFLSVLATYVKLAAAVALVFLVVFSVLGLPINDVSFLSVFFGLWLSLWLSPAIGALIAQRKLQLPAKNAA